MKGSVPACLQAALARKSGRLCYTFLLGCKHSETEEKAVQNVRERDSKIGECQDEIEELKRMRQTLESELASAQAGLKKGDERSAEKDAEILKLNNELAARDKEIGDLKQQIKDAQSEIGRLRDEINRSERERLTIMCESLSVGALTPPRPL